ncbi:MAG: flagellar basal body rod protein FlgC [Bacteroidales bacterium]
MNLFRSMEISASGLKAQRLAIDAISLNLANIQTTKTDEGGPYRKRKAVFFSPHQSQSFREILDKSLFTVTPLLRTHPNHLNMLILPHGVMPDIREEVEAELYVSPDDYKLIFDPNHPDSDEKGYLRLPNINVIEEMVNLLNALRNFEANITAFNASKDMILKALEIGR